jgi:hypothetical protein
MMMKFVTKLQHCMKRRHPCVFPTRPELKCRLNHVISRPPMTDRPAYYNVDDLWKVKGLTPNEWSDLLTGAKHMTFPPNYVILRQGKSKFFYF